nr:DUF3387 domain-containing protein [Chloroflexia bacterium]
LLDRSIATEGYVIREGSDSYGNEGLVDLSQIDFDGLRARFEAGQRRIEAEKLRGAVSTNLAEMIRLNPYRIDYLERFQQLIDEYNSGSVNLEEYFRRLSELAQSLGQEQQRHIAENLTEEELALFDLLMKPAPDLSQKEQQQVKKVARDLLAKLNNELLVLDWKKRQQTRAAVRLSIETLLEQLPETYTKDIFDEKCEAAYQHFYEKYPGAGRSVYTSAA